MNYTKVTHTLSINVHMTHTASNNPSHAALAEIIFKSQKEGQADVTKSHQKIFNLSIHICLLVKLMGREG